MSAVEITPMRANAESKQGSCVKRFPDAVLKVLNDWVSANLRNPYLTQDAKTKLAEQTGLKPCQVQQWMTNWRKRNRTPLISGKRKPSRLLDAKILEAFDAGEPVPKRVKASAPVSPPKAPPASPRRQSTPGPRDSQSKDGIGNAAVEKHCKSPMPAVQRVRTRAPDAVETPRKAGRPGCNIAFSVVPEGSFPPLLLAKASSVRWPFDKHPCAAKKPSGGHYGQSAQCLEPCPEAAPEAQWHYEECEWMRCDDPPAYAVGDDLDGDSYFLSWVDGMGIGT